MNYRELIKVSVVKAWCFGGEGNNFWRFWNPIPSWLGFSRILASASINSLLSSWLISSQTASDSWVILLRMPSQCKTKCHSAKDLVKIFQIKHRHYWANFLAELAFTIPKISASLFTESVKIRDNPSLGEVNPKPVADVISEFASRLQSTQFQCREHSIRIFNQDTVFSAESWGRVLEIKTAFKHFMQC